MTTKIATPVDYEAEFIHLSNEIKVLRESYSDVVVEAQALCDHVNRFKTALERVEALEGIAEKSGEMAALIEARTIKNGLWDAIMNSAEEVSLRISQLPPGATFIDPKTDTDPAADLLGASAPNTPAAAEAPAPRRMRP